MTTSSFHHHYIDRKEPESPSIEVYTRFSFWNMIKMIMLGEYAHVSHELTEAEIDHLARTIVRYKLTKRLRAERKSAT